MAEELYVNKNGFKCVRTQLAKTDGADPQEYELARRSGQRTDTLKVRAPEFKEA